MGAIMISVIMPVYNNSMYLKESIDSILNQTFSNFEFIILDDNSTESVLDIIESYEDERIRLIKNKKNIGLTKSLNICLDAVKGDIIARQDSDDISHPDRFKKELSMLGGDVGLVSSYASRFNPNRVFMDKWLRKDIRLSDADLKKQIKISNCIVGPAAIYPKFVFDKIGYYDESLYLAQDYNYWIRTLKYFDVKICREDLYSLRSHSKSVRTVRSANDDTDWVKLCKERAKEEPIIK
jgi:glycosyltransferase involved in cell wall biosynthesis